MCDATCAATAALPGDRDPAKRCTCPTLCVTDYPEDFLEFFGICLKKLQNKFREFIKFIQTGLRPIDGHYVALLFVLLWGA